MNARGDATVLLAGGGTGGHVFPSLAVAEALRAARPDLRVEFVGTSRGLESQLVPQAGWTLHTVGALPLARRLSPATLRLPVVVLSAARAVGELIRTRGVVAGCGLGGYVSVPLALAARRAHIPLVLHEQNAVPGLANRLAARWAHTVAVSFPDSAQRFPRPDRVVVTGNPVRPGLAGVDRAALRAEALAAFDLDPDRSTLLVFGGSQGARRLNEAVVAGAALWAAPERLQILHATGRGAHAAVTAAWQAALASPGRAVPVVRCQDFIARMDLAYAAADVVVCRAGASSIAELTVLGLPSVLVPYPHATADHQSANARALAAAGGALVVTDADLDAAALVDACEPLLLQPARRAEVAAAAGAFGRPDAAAAVADLVLSALARAGSAPPAAGERSAAQPAPRERSP
ncbi:MAG TPA: undecaprenyldiphospho-muramoylpentapeptide beta-N-acetylglucosaminyltransferase [Egibacteraceae bacterium]|nr:undecaprenyldiphospho-muramoylpentapeptide beta-N-acetylglucosaminyltransferase [Egibacteraceae bacterium]